MSQNRWEKISKKFTDDPGVVTSASVKRFLDLNFTDGYEEELCGSSKKQQTIDPSLIMDLRHEAVKNAKCQKSATSKFKAQKELNMENIRNHNNLVESRMIANELSKFKLDIRKLSSKSSVVSQRYEDSLEDSFDDDDEEKSLLQALRDSEDGTFAYKNEKNNIVVEKKKPPRYEVCEFSYEEGSGLSGSTATISEDSQEKVVHFENDYIKVSTQLKSGDREEFREYFDIAEAPEKFNVEDDEADDSRRAYDDDCLMCCNDETCQFLKPDFDMQSFHSLPNLNDGDIESLMRITRFQSMVTVETTTIQDCACCTSDLVEVTVDKKIEMLNKSIEEAETEKMLIVRRMEIEEKNYRELIIMSNAHSTNINSSPEFECEKIIIDLFKESEEKPQDPAEMELMKKCFKDWLQKTTVSKILKTNAFNNEDRIKKINSFLNKIRLEQNKVGNTKSKKDTKSYSKPPTSSKSSKSLRKDYEHKMKVQQDIIELQKLKIQRQEKYITEMKLAKFSEMVKESKNDLKMELINAKRGNTKLRAKARCIQMTANIPPDPIEEEHRKLLAQGIVVPKFLQKMQERTIERLARHQEARERRVRMEIDKEEQKNAADIAKRQEDEEAKRKRLQEMREKRRQEKLAKVLKEQERQLFQENLKKARDHYTKTLLKRLGFRVFELLIRLKRTNHKKATIHRRKMCMKKCFKLWHLNAKIVWDKKRAQADRLYELSLVRCCVKVWKHVHNIHKSKFLVAIDWYEIKITEKLFRNWLQFKQQSKFIENSKTRKADAHYNCQIKWKLFDCWHRFPAIMKIERETDVRRQKWRMKIWDLLPDYQPQDTA